MKPFTFRLDKILDYRKYLKKTAQIDLFNAKNECLRREKEIIRLDEQRIAIAKNCMDEGFKGIDVPRYKIYQTYLQKIDHDLESAHISLKEGEEDVMTKKILLKNKSIKAKTLETLKDVQHNKYMKSSEREDQKILDEIVIIGRERRV